MPTPTVPDAVTVATLARVEALLGRAAEQWWSQVQHEGPHSARCLLALGAQVAAAQAVGLLPPADATDRLPPAAVEQHPVEQHPVELLRAAETLTRTVEARQQPAGLPVLVVAICDLIREATRAEVDG